MSAMLKVIALANGMSFIRPLWVESYNVDVEPIQKESLWRKDGGCIINGHFGGRIVLTPDSAKAQRFNNAGEALTAWNTRSTTRPTRPDGRPNKPLTVLTVEVVSE